MKKTILILSGLAKHKIPFYVISCQNFTFSGFSVEHLSQKIMIALNHSKTIIP